MQSRDLVESLSIKILDSESRRRSSKLSTGRSTQVTLVKKELNHVTVSFLTGRKLLELSELGTKLLERALRQFVVVKELVKATRDHLDLAVKRENQTSKLSERCCPSALDIVKIVVRFSRVVEENKLAIIVKVNAQEATRILNTFSFKHQKLSQSRSVTALETGPLLNSVRVRSNLGGDQLDKLENIWMHLAFLFEVYHHW
jgi:hypothetical protein